MFRHGRGVDGSGNGAVIMTLLAIGLVPPFRGRPRHRDAKFPWLLLLPAQPYWMNDQMINNDRIRSGQMRGFFNLRVVY